MMDKMQILWGVAYAHNVTTERLLGRQRDQKISEARAIAMYLLRELSGDTWQGIGRFLNKDHSSVMCGYHKVKRRMRAAPAYGRWVGTVRAAIWEERACLA